MVNLNSIKKFKKNNIGIENDRLIYIKDYSFLGFKFWVLCVFLEEFFFVIWLKY